MCNVAMHFWEPHKSHPSPIFAPPLCRWEVQRVREEREDSAAFLLACLADARQELLAQQGRAELAGLSPPAGTGTTAPGLGAIAERAQQDEESGSGEGDLLGGSASLCNSAAGSRTAPEPAAVQLAELPPQQRQAVLLRLLERLGVDWRAREGLLLPATSGSWPAGPGAAGAAVAAAVEQGAVTKPLPAGGSTGAAPSRGACLRSSSGVRSTGRVLSSGSKGACSRSELLELVLSDVRPWGERSLSSGIVPAAAVGPASPSSRRLASVASEGSR